jgi:brefeldin A-resistance guanine nucleotide exchange factor 1
MSTSPDFWAILHNLQGIREAAPHVFSILEDLAEPPYTAITVDNYEPAIALLNSFASAGSIGANDEQKRDNGLKRTKQPKSSGKTKQREEVTRGAKAVNIVYRLTSRVPSFITQSHLETTEAWNTYWSPIFHVLTTQCLNPCREIRHRALSSLQRALLSKDLASPDHKEWTAIFSEVLFPLINQLLKPEVYQSDPLGMGETRVQAATGLCKIFLHYLVVLASWDGMLDLWLKILGMMERLMNSGVGDNLVRISGAREFLHHSLEPLLTKSQEEAVPESLKNILLVMADSGYLAPPDQKPEQKDLWEQTWKRLDRFLPSLHGELFPEDGKDKTQQKLPLRKSQDVAGDAVAKNKENSPVTVKEKEKEKDGEVVGKE